MGDRRCRARAPRSQGLAAARLGLRLPGTRPSPAPRGSARRLCRAPSTPPTKPPQPSPPCPAVREALWCWRRRADACGAAPALRERRELAANKPRPASKLAPMYRTSPHAPHAGRETHSCVCVCVWSRPVSSLSRAPGLASAPWLLSRPLRCTARGRHAAVRARGRGPWTGVLINGTAAACASPHGLHGGDVALHCRALNCCRAGPWLAWVAWMGALGLWALGTAGCPPVHLEGSGTRPLAGRGVASRGSCRAALRCAVLGARSPRLPPATPGGTHPRPYAPGIALGEGRAGGWAAAGGGQMPAVVSWGLCCCRLPWLPGRRRPCASTAACRGGPVWRASGMERAPREAI